jgi:PAS domain S-box-containing protein
VENEWYAVGTVRDISDRKEAEKALRFTQHSVDTSPDAVFWIQAEDARILYTNTQACRHLGYESEELLSMHIYDIDPDFPKEKWSDFVTHLKQEGSMSLESRHMKKNGKVFPVEVTANHLTFEGNDYVMATTRDITERKKAEEELRQNMEELQQFSDMSIGREERMIELKEEINGLLDEMGQPPKYKIVE